MDFLKKVDRLIPVAGKAIYFTFTGLRAKMLGRTYVDILNFLQYEFTLPETEETWKKRQDLLVELAAFFDSRKDNSVLPKDFVERVKAILPDIVTAASSERTTLSAQACRVVCCIAKHLESQIQPQLDMLLSQLIIHCGSAKGVNQKNANDAIVTICKHAGYSPRLFYHVCAAFRDKRIPPRTYAPEWLRILLSSYRTQMDREKDGEAAKTAIYQGLTDGQVKVRENSRAVYWEYATYDVQGARMIMGGLNPHAQAALREDSHNPDKTAAKLARAPRPDSALASIKAQNKQRLQQRRGFTPASVKPDDFVFGSMEDLDAPTYKKSAPKAGAEAAGERQEKRAPEPHHAGHQSDSAGSSRQGISVQPRTTTKVSKDTKLETSKEQKASSSQADARPLLSAPVRRGRIVATPMTNPSQRPGSRGEPSKKSSEVKDKSLPDKSSGRQTPITVDEKDVLSSSVIHHRKTASRHDAVRLDDKDLSVTSILQNIKRSSQQQTPVVAKYKESSGHPTTQSTKKTERPTHVVTDDQEPPTLAPVPPKKPTLPIAVLAEDKAGSASVSSKSSKETMAAEQVTEQLVLPVTLPLRPVKAFPQEKHSALPSTERSLDKDSSRQHVAEGKENSYVIRPRKRTSPTTSPRRSPNRSSNQSPKRSPRHNSIAASAKKSLATATEYLRHGSLDALGYRRLRKLIEDHPGVLITSQTQFNDLFELLIGKLASLDELVEPREKRLETLSHPAYHRHTILLIIFLLFRQYPHWPEPQPGMTLSALLIARCNHSSGYIATLRAIDNAAEVLCTSTEDLLPSIDAVLDTLEQIEHIITTNDPIVTPMSTTTVLSTSLQSLASEFGPERPRFSNRLPIIMAFGLRVLCLLLERLACRGQTLYTIQEDRLGSFAEHLLVTYTSLIKRYVLDYCTALHAVIKPEKRFYQYFRNESDRNLINYFVAGHQDVEMQDVDMLDVEMDMAMAMEYGSLQSSVSL